MPMFKRDRDPYQTSPVSTVTNPSPFAPSDTPSRETPAPVLDEVAGQAEQPASQPTITPANRAAAAVVDKKSEIKGTLHSQGNVLVEGCFQGEIEAKETVWVEKGAQTEGQLRANDVVISGSFNGEVVCQHRLQIAATATVSGEIKTPVLVIEDGATVNCRFSMKRSGR